jgi:hypothetical protein
MSHRGHWQLLLDEHPVQLLEIAVIEHLPIMFAGICAALSESVRMCTQDRDRRLPAKV